MEVALVGGGRTRWYNKAVSRWGLVALLLVVLLGGSATAARSSDRATGKSFSIKSRFRVDFTGTNTVQWTLTPGSSCSATGSGRQQIHVSSSGRTIRLELYIYRGKVVYVGSTGASDAVFFRVSQRDDREGSITGDPASGDCQGLIGNDFVLGGPDSLCGVARNEGPQLIGFLGERRQGFPYNFVVRNGGAELGFDDNALGAPYDGSGLDGVGDEVYYTYPDPQLPDCPLAGDSWLNYVANGHALGNDGGANDFLLTRHNSTDGVFTVPSFAPFSLRKLETCRAKTITAHTSARKTSSGPFSWSDGDPNGAHWTATTALHWKMTLHRLDGCVRKRE